jgi:hypothetical protein
MRKEARMEARLSPDYIALQPRDCSLQLSNFFKKRTEVG